jgi:hypothetical protein
MLATRTSLRLSHGQSWSSISIISIIGAYSLATTLYELVKAKPRVFGRAAKLGT